MKLKYILTVALAMPALLWSCKDDDAPFGNPVIDYRDATETAHFGDSLSFTVNAADSEVALSTLKAQLYYGDEMVEETVIRTKESGKDYTGKIYLPYFANVPDGTATLKLVLQNINFTITEHEYPVRITHPDFPYLTLRDEDGNTYRMEKTGADTYAVSERFPQKMKAYIIAPKVGENGNELIFGYENSQIKIGAEGAIPFTSSRGGKYAVELNTRTFAASPFSVLKLNGYELVGVDDNTARVDMTLSQGQTITPEGFPNFGEWWIDTDWFTRNDDGSLTFNAMSGSYRVIADQKLQYFRVETLLNGEPASLQADGTGALWVIGADFGKPGLSTNETGWTTEKAVCMAPVSSKVYQMTLVGGKTVNTKSTNFKFYGDAMSWGNEFKHDRLSTTSTLIGVGDGDSHDDGNLYLLDGVTLKDNVIYVFTVDFTAGVNNGVLTVTEAGEQAFEEKPIYLNGVKMSTVDNAVYTLVTDLAQGTALQFNSVDGLAAYYFDPDFMSYDADNDVITFIPVDGQYEVTLDKLNSVVSAQRTEGGNYATLGSDGHGAVYILGWGAGHPDLNSQFGWDTAKAYGMAEVSPRVYRFTAVAGPETGSAIGQRLRADYMSIKFFHQKGWGGEFNPSQGNGLSVAPGSESLLKANPDGNFELASTLDEGATYMLTIDLSAGNDAGTISLVKK
ncbi:MAG: DUF5125 domain-containing protein [Muribaculaceae bacterium]|nr:DUF5125 domain-containing protein [Muribaculaceae bacterium]